MASSSSKASSSSSARADSRGKQAASLISNIGANSVGSGAQVGAVLKRLRKGSGLSLLSLSRAAKVSVGTLSQIERGISNPSVRVLTQIRLALDVPLTAFFEEAPLATTDPPFVRRGIHHPRLDLGGHFVKELLTSNTPHNLQMMILHIPPKGSSGDKHLSYPAEKGGLVLDGEIRLSVDGRAALLGPGDSFTFDSLSPHGFVNPSNTKAARVLWVIGKIPLERHL
jgi:transcriptional regulator with XRE-family HTH domain